MSYKSFILIVLLLFFFSLGSVCASGDDLGIFPVNDTFVDNDTEFSDEFHSSIDSGFDNNDFNSSSDDLIFNNSSLDFNSSNMDFVFNNSGLDFNFSFDEGSINSPLALIQTSISASNLVMDFQDGSTLNAYLKDKNNNPLSGKTLKFNINGLNYNRITNSNGIAELIIIENPGVYTTTISFQGSGYASSSKTVTVTVHEMPSNIIANNISMYYRDGSAISATLTDRNGNPLVNKIVTLNLEGHNYTRVTNGNGRIGFGIYARPGNYTFNLTFEDTGYLPANRLVNVVVYEMSTNIDSNDVNMYYRDGSAITATLTGIMGIRLANKTIILSLDGHNYTRITNDNGRIGFGIYARPGNYTFNLTFQDIGYVSSSKLVNVVVQEIPTTIIANNLVMYYGDSTRLYAALRDKDNNPLVNKTLLYYFNGNVYSRVSNDFGRVGVTINANPSIYDATITFSEIGYATAIKHVNVTILGGTYPSVNVSSGIYNVSELTLGIFLNDAASYNYSWDEINWTTSTQSVAFNLNRGEYDLYLSNGAYNFHYHYLIDNIAPFVWASHNSDLYNSSFLVNLSSWDNLDNTTPIYYTLNGSDPLVGGVLYDTPLNISNTTTLKFYTRDSAGHMSSVFTCNYIFGKVGNLNSGRGYGRIQDAIDDASTVDGNLIKVSAGLYQENIIVNKTLNFIADNSIVKSVNPGRAVIRVTSKGNASFIYGFNIINSTMGVVLDNTSNVSLLFNSFHNVVNSIVVEGEDNLISGNKITSDYLMDMVGIKIIESKNLIIYNNTICLNSNSNSTCILSESVLSDGLSISYNTITNLNHGKSIALSLLGSNVNVEYNKVFNVNVGVYVIDLNNSFIAHNTLFENIDGIFIRNSINNTYCSNNIYENDYYGVILATGSICINDSFYLNRLCNDECYDFYSKSNSIFVIDDNWWGYECPDVSINRDVLASIYNNTGNLVLNSWVVITLYSCSYKVDSISFIERIKYYVDLTYNNLNQCLSYKGYIPDGLDANISISNIYGEVKYSLTYLKNGKTFADFELSNFFRNLNIIFDHQQFIFSDIYSAKIDVNCLSSAWNIDKNCTVEERISVYFDENPSWITISWAETGLYTGVIYLIINGEVVKEVNITNKYYQMFKDNYSSNVFDAMNFYNRFFASDKDGVWVPNIDYFNFAQIANIDYTNIREVYLRFLSYISLYYNLTDDDLIFILQYNQYFVDKIAMLVDFHGDVAGDVNFVYNNERQLLSPVTSFAYRVSNIYYSNGVNESGVNVGFEGMRSFAVARDNVTRENLRYWLNQKPLYSPGLMKADYGTFLSALLVIYESDRVADEAAEKFNVSWSRISPTCVSLCNDYNCVYITGESNHNLGREAVGNSSSVWKFNFATSFSFSLVEQLVGNNIWNTTKIGSVTLGLLESYLNNETLEIFFSNGYIFIKKANDNSSLLYLDVETGIVHDYLSFYGIMGLMFCYCDPISDNAWEYGNNIYNDSSKEFFDMKTIFSSCIMSSVMMEGLSTFVLDASPVLSGISLGVGFLLFIPMVMFVFPDEVNELWLEFAYLINPEARDYPNITIYEGMDYNSANIFPENEIILYLNGMSLEEYIISEFSKKNGGYLGKDTYKYYQKKLDKDKNSYYNLAYAPSPDDSPNGTDAENWINVGENIRKLYEEFNIAVKNGKILYFISSNLFDIFGIVNAMTTIPTFNLIIQIINELLNDNERKNNSTDNASGYP